MVSTDGQVVDRLFDYLDASPSPYHAVASSAAALSAAGATELAETDDWSDATRGCFVVRDGALVAWWMPPGSPPHAPFHLVGAHTDSPNLRIKPRPDTGRAGYRQLGVEVYGGTLLNSWLDRDLGLSGRVAVRTATGVEMRLVAVDEPLLRVAQLAIHLDREVNEGLVLDRQQHLAPIWGLGRPTDGGFAGWLSELVDGEAVAWDLMAHDLTPATRLGDGGEVYASGRIDNLASCHAGTEALAAVMSAGDGAAGDTAPVAVLCLFDHEEVGSTSGTGAVGPLLRDVLERLVLVRGGDRQDLHRAVAGSWCVSADGAHAVHPNYLDRHEPEHHVHLNGGPVVKVNTNVRYASDAAGIAMFADVCRSVDVTLQQYAHRTNLPCGSTIGPLTAANLGMRTVDVGMAQLSMHSARELGGVDDPALMVSALTRFLGGR